MPDLISFLIIDPNPIKQLSPILTPFLIIVPLPIKVLDPTVTSPLIITPVEMWVLFPILTSCSIMAEVFIIVFDPIEELPLITTLLKTTVPSLIWDLLETIASLAIIVAILNFFFLRLEKISDLTVLSLICPTVTKKYKSFFLLIFSRYLSSPRIRKS